MKHIYLVSLCSLMAVCAMAQSFSSSDVTPWVAGPTDQIIHSYGNITNDAGAAKMVHCKRTIITEGAGTSNYFCWTQCYGPGTDQSPVPFEITAGTTTEIFGGYYQANGFVGYSTIRYTFFEEGNENDSTSFEVTYSTDPNGVLDAFSSGDAGLSVAYPNPANAETSMRYSLNPGTVNASVEMFDVLGAKVRKFNLEENEGELEVQLSALPAGLYFFNLNVDGRTIETRKLMVSH